MPSSALRGAAHATGEGTVVLVVHGPNNGCSPRPWARLRTCLYPMPLTAADQGHFLARTPSAQGPGRVDRGPSLVVSWLRGRGAPALPGTALGPAGK